MTPVKCLVDCNNANSRFGLLHRGNTCHCFKSLPVDDLIPLPGDQCNFPCTGDNNQLCGGIASNAAYVHRAQSSIVPHILCIIGNHAVARQRDDH